MFDALLCMDVMTASVVGFILLGLGAVIFFSGGWFRAVVIVLFRLSRSFDKNMRRNLRPSRIFLIRHGESEANIDRSKHSLIIS